MLLPGKPQAALQAICTGEWQRNRIVAYLSGTSLAILTGPHSLVQTIYHDRTLAAVVLDEATGKIAVCEKGGSVAAATEVFIYQPNGRGGEHLKWALQTQFTLDERDGSASALSWGCAEELLVGSNSLTLWSTSPDAAGVQLLWRRPLSNPVKLALFSYDASLACSIAEHDSLVKVWWKVSIGTDDNQFDFTYLAHPRAVKWMQWRQPAHPEETVDNVLYTITVDQVLRVWAPVLPHDPPHQLQLWATIDLKESIPLLLDEREDHDDVRHALVLDARVFRIAAERAVATVAPGQTETDTLQRLVEVANRSPEVVVVFDSRGKMSAWGLENVGCKARKTINIFSIVHSESSDLPGSRDDVRFVAFPGGATGLVVLAHFFDGKIMWMESRLDVLLDPSPKEKRRLHAKAVWTGHDGAVRSMVRTADGRSMLASTDTNEHLLWTKTAIRGVDSLELKSQLESRSKVERAVILENGHYVMTLHAGHVVVWDTTSKTSVEIARCSFTSNGRMLCLLLLPETAVIPPVYHVVAVDEQMTGIAWEIKTPHQSQTHGTTTTRSYLRELAKFDLGARDGLLAIIPVDPVGWNAVLSENLDMFSREVVTTVSKAGLLRCWTVKVFQDESSVKWLATSTVDTGVRNPFLAIGNSIRKIALASENKSELTIWDNRAAQLEYRKEFPPDDPIHDLDWTSTPQSQSILAVGFLHRVLLMCQLRYDYLNAGPAWAPFREINISSMTPHPIGDSIWLHNGGLVIGSGNQLFLYPRKIVGPDEMLDSLHLSSHKTKLDDVFDIVSELNGPLPVYHPQFLQQCILSGKPKLAETVLVKLYKELRNYHEEIGLDPLLDIPIETFYTAEDHTTKARTNAYGGSLFDAYQNGEEEDMSTFDETLATKLCTLLTTIAIPHLTGREQINLAAIVESVAQVDKHRRSIDEFGAQFLLFFRQYALRRDKAVQAMSYREITWAFHSDSQEILVDLVNHHCQGRMMWPQARESGIFMWLKDTEAVKRQFEAVARNHYTSTDEKNPVDCSLYYLALKKKNVLLGLWRMASWHREQTTTMRFLSNNFSEPRWKTAALKNAYALLGKRRFEYAAAFFLLADHLPDALTVCLNNLHDPHLAIAIARVYEPSISSSSSSPDVGPHLRKFLETRILPLAHALGDRWLATWGFWMLGRRDCAVLSLLSPPPLFLDSSIFSGEEEKEEQQQQQQQQRKREDSGDARDPNSRMFLLNDPALLIFYRAVREKTVTTLRGARQISPEEEFQFVLRTAGLYDRMGCDLLALDLVVNWEFLPGAVANGGGGGGGGGALGDIFAAAAGGGGGRVRRGSVLVNDVPPPLGLVAEKSKEGEEGEEEEGREGEKWKQGRVKPAPAVWEEPDMSWAF